METKARLIHSLRSLDSGKTVLTMEVDNSPDLDKIREKDLRLTIVQWREKRSLNANAYFHLLCGKIAEATQQSLTEVKNQMICDYGQPEYETTRHGERAIAHIWLGAWVDWRKAEYMHLHPTVKSWEKEPDLIYFAYIVMRGSHTYDTAEMAHLIDGTISEAEQLGIETITPNEKARMMSAWTASCRNKKADATSADEAERCTGIM